MEEIKIGKYRHFKGNEYQVLYIGKDSETCEDVVVSKPYTEKARYGFALQKCGMKPLYVTARNINDLH